MNAQPSLSLFTSLLALLLAPAAGLADPPYGLYTTALLSPRPTVTLKEVVTVGSDLAVTLDWPIAGDPLPLSARLKLLDLEGMAAGAVDFSPGYGPQTVWIPGGALPRSSELATWPLHRYLELVAAPSREILLEGGVDLNQSGPARPVQSYPRRPKPAALGRICTLYVDHIRMFDSEDYNGDDPTLYLSGGLGPFYWEEDLKPTVDLLLEDSFILCDTCHGIEKTISMELVDRDDPGWPLFDSDDELGTVSVSGCSTTDWTTTPISGSGYSYELVYRVLCAETTCS